jgi:hypothetical protein
VWPATDRAACGDQELDQDARRISLTVRLNGAHQVAGEPVKGFFG